MTVAAAPAASILPDDEAARRSSGDRDDAVAAAPAGLRASKKRSTRATLAEAALELTRERGYDGFTITDLVDRVGVSRRTFSNYFAGKAECVAAGGGRHRAEP
jgi:AcrR family transcriptional regulator